MATNLMKHALAITRLIRADQLYEWIMLVTRAIDGGGTGGAPGPYDTVLKASSKRMLDATVAQLQALKNGAEVWVESYKSEWYWDTQFPAATATDNVTTCRPTAWIATGNNGAFVRSTEGDRGAWNQTAWHVSLSGDDENDGLTALTPLASDAEILRRWGPGTIPISKAVTINYAGTPVGSTNFDVTYEAGGSLKVVGVATQQVAGVLATVVAQNRSTGQLWTIGGPAFLEAHVGLLVEITASAVPGNVGAYASILEIDEGLNFTVSPFGKVGVDPDVEFEEVTPLVGDTVRVISVTRLKLGTIRVHPGSFDEFTLSPIANCTVFDLVWFDGAADSGNVVGMIETSCPAFYQRCRYSNMKLGGNGDEMHKICGGAVVGLVSVQGGTSARFFSTGFLGDDDGGIEMCAGADVWLDQDCYFIDAVIDVLGPCHIRSNGTAYANSGGDGLELAAGALYEQRGDVPDWGTNNDDHGISVLVGATYIFDELPTVNAGDGEDHEALVGGTDKLWEDIPYIEGANGAAIVQAT